MPLRLRKRPRSTCSGRTAEARLLLEAALRVWRGVQTTYGQDFDAYLRYYLALNALNEGDLDTARSEFEASLTRLQVAGDDMAQAVVLGMLGPGRRPAWRPRRSAQQVRPGPTGAPARQRRLGSGPAAAERRPGRGAGGGRRPPARCSSMRSAAGSTLDARLAWPSRWPGWERSRR